MSVPSDISELQRTYIVSLILTFILWVKFQVVIMKQGSVAFLADTRAPEDDSFGQKPKEVTDAAIALDRRWRRVVGNDMEQIPIGLIVLWGAGIVCSTSVENDAQEWTSQAVRILFMIFTAGRVLHSIAFAYEAQPWRTIAWTIAWLAVFIGGLIAVIEGAKNL